MRLRPSTVPFMLAVAVASSTAASANPRLERTDTAISVALAEPIEFCKDGGGGGGSGGGGGGGSGGGGSGGGGGGGSGGGGSVAAVAVAPEAAVLAAAGGGSGGGGSGGGGGGGSGGGGSGGGCGGGAGGGGSGRRRCWLEVAVLAVAVLEAVALAAVVPAAVAPEAVAAEVAAALVLALLRRRDGCGCDTRRWQFGWCRWRRHRDGLGSGQCWSSQRVRIQRGLQWRRRRLGRRQLLWKGNSAGKSSRLFLARDLLQPRSLQDRGRLLDGCLHSAIAAGTLSLTHARVSNPRRATDAPEHWRASRSSAPESISLCHRLNTSLRKGRGLVSPGCTSGRAQSAEDRLLHAGVTRIERKDSGMRRKIVIPIPISELPCAIVADRNRGAHVQPARAELRRKDGIQTCA